MAPCGFPFGCLARIATRRDVAQQIPFGRSREPLGRGFTRRFGTSSFANLCECKELEVLFVDNGFIRDEELQQLSHTLLRLRRIEISGAVGFSEHGLASLLSIESLREFEWTGRGRLIRPVDFAVIGQQRDLQRLRVEVCGLEGPNLGDALGTAVKELNQLQQLNIASTPFTALLTAGIGALQRLESLELRFCGGMHAVDLSPLAALKRLRSLRVVAKGYEPYVDLSPFLAQLDSLIDFGCEHCTWGKAQDEDIAHSKANFARILGGLQEVEAASSCGCLLPSRMRLHRLISAKRTYVAGGSVDAGHPWRQCELEQYHAPRLGRSGARMDGRIVQNAAGGGN
jgi:hypothetical protein